MSHVIVVGAGPGGAVLSLLLARAGARVTLLERHMDFSREFRGEVLMPGGLEPFAQMDLWEQLDSVPHVAFQQFQIFLAGRLAQRLEIDSEHFGRFGPRWVSQPALLEMLQRRAPHVILSDRWWNRALFRLLPLFARGQIHRPRNRGVFGRFAWGVSEVRLEG